MAKVQFGIKQTLAAQKIEGQKGIIINEGQWFTTELQNFLTSGRSPICCTDRVTLKITHGN
jgi:hypothetical protein